MYQNNPNELNAIDYETISEIYELGNAHMGLQQFYFFLINNQTKDGTTYFDLLQTKEGIQELKQIVEAIE